MSHEGHHAEHHDSHGQDHGHAKSGSLTIDSAPKAAKEAVVDTVTAARDSVGVAPLTDMATGVIMEFVGGEVSGLEQTFKDFTPAGGGGGDAGHDSHSSGGHH